MHKHFIFNKPYNCLSQFIFEGKRKANKRLLGEFYDFPEGTMAIGRLDNDSEGLLLLTTDGKVSEAIRSARYEKEYYVQVDGIVTQEAIDKLEQGVEIGFNGKKYITKTCTARIIEAPTNLPIEPRKIRHERHGPMTWIAIILTEGKFRQVRKMTAAVGHATQRLVRVRIGNLRLDIAPNKIKEFSISQLFHK